MEDRFKFRIIAEKEVKTFNGTFKGQSIYYCNGFIQTKLKTYFFGNHKKYSFLNSQIKAINQCTGLKDKNGKLIYEGDIVKFNFDTDEIKAVVSWDDKELIGFYLNTTDYFKDKYVTDYDFYKNDYEVIGNRYQNPELLED